MKIEHVEMYVNDPEKVNFMFIEKSWICEVI